MVSIRTAICSSPLPRTSYASVLSVFKTCKETLLKISSSNLSLICLVVKYFPSLPAKGLLLTQNNIETVGSSISILGRGSGFSFEETVSPMVMFSSPATAIMSPDSSLFTLIFFSPLNVYRAENFCPDTVFSSPQSE